MNLSELWRLYEADKRIQGFSSSTLKAYSLQQRMLASELGDLDISEITLQQLKEYLAKQSDRLKPNSGAGSDLFAPCFGLLMKRHT
ncbi:MULTISPECIES: integrase [Paenibacillus]|uniref:integrase n=1 Tax=Paenibacillus TaxID=44249 RepID=UPI0022B92D41|nr:integrase [Paenibacillus caseinilyticus]MCZ8520964.1 integrase [Paenibacillus caseinilyticus]